MEARSGYSSLPHVPVSDGDGPSGEHTEGYNGDGPSGEHRENRHPLWGTRVRGQIMAQMPLGFRNQCWQSEGWQPGPKSDMGRAEIGT